MSEQLLDEAKPRIGLGADPALGPETLKAMAARIDARLEDVMSSDGEESRLVCAMRHGLLSPGKRFRPIITILAHRQFGGADDGVIDAACAIEMVHAASLIMDDLPSMDDARLRRGGLATHVVFGESAASLATIALLAKAFKMISGCNRAPPENRVAAIGILADSVGCCGLAGGQTRDLAAVAACATGATLCEIEKRHDEKTGALFSAAAEIGAALAGADERSRRIMRDYGRSLGLAYQAFDDVVDAACTTERAGKDTAKDSGRSTVVTLLGPEGAKRAAVRWLDRAIEAAQSVSAGGPAPLADLARLVGAKFNALIA